MTVPPSDPSHDSHDDEVFRQIVEGFQTPSADPVPRWPVSEDVGDDAPREPQPAAVEEPQPDVGLPGWLEPAALPDEGHYVPPVPPRLPRPKPRTLVALATLLAGLAVLFVPFKVGLDDSAPSLLIGVALTGGGAALLLTSMRDAPEQPDDPNDGAVV